MALMAMAEAEGEFDKALPNSEAHRQWVAMLATLSPDDLSVIRKERGRYDSCCYVQGMPTSESLAVSAAPQLASRDGHTRQMVIVHDNPDVRRKWAPMLGAPSLYGLSVARLARSRYDSCTCCDLKGMTTSASLAMSAAPQLVSRHGYARQMVIAHDNADP